MVLHLNTSSFDKIKSKINDCNSDKNDCDIRDVGKKVTKMETKMEEILEQLQVGCD